MSKRAQKFIKRAQKIIKQIVGKDNNWKRLLPIEQANIGGLLYCWDYTPHEDYKNHFFDSAFELTVQDEKEYVEPRIKPHTIIYNSFVSVEKMESEVYEYENFVEEYNEWVKEINDKHESMKPEKGPYSKGSLLDEWGAEYLKMYFPPKYEFTVKTVNPKCRTMENDEVISSYCLDDAALYKALHEMCIWPHEGKLKIIHNSLEHYTEMFNLMIFDHIQEMKEVAKDADDWNEDNIYWLPNKEFVRWFQERGIVPKNVYRFEDFSTTRDFFSKENNIENTKYTEANMRRIFDGPTEFTDDSVTLLDLAEKCVSIYEENRYHFDSRRDCYREACKWWTLKGVKKTQQSKNRPKDGNIHWEQLEKALHK